MAFAQINGNMGINRLGDPSIIFKRKFRWTLALSPLAGSGDIDPWFVKVASRPSMTIDTTELNFLNEKMWIPGKVTYEAMNVTFLDVAPKEPASANLYKWLSLVFQYNALTRQMGGSIQNYAAAGQLTMYDGCGKPIERWNYSDLWPASIKFGDLDYGSSDVVNVELSLRFTRFTYEPLCSPFAFPKVGCSNC